jgi:hypothetical protein
MDRCPLTDVAIVALREASLMSKVTVIDCEVSEEDSMRSSG